MACPRCGCKVHYQYDDDDVFPTDGLERCAACGHIFDEEEGFDADDECAADIAEESQASAQLPQ